MPVRAAAVAHFYPAPLGYVSPGLILTGLQGFPLHTMYLHGQLRYEVELKSQISGRLNLAPSHMVNRFLEPPTQKKYEFTQFERDSDSTALDASLVKQVNIKLGLGLASKK
ncbi:hypothetical protein B0H13DRAFT_1869696 [Mycena leptocephala]|nr:hypothetical protein B0H13DRAFT_1869696 [Mycena leptocephala]